MSGKIAQIKNIIDEQNLAKRLAELYNRWWIQRSEKEKEWRELRNYLFATDTTKTTNAKLPWKNKTTLPKLTQIRDNLHANYMDALFPNDNWLRWEGYTTDSVLQKKRIVIENYMRNKCRVSGFRETISKLVYDYIDYGNVFAEVVWENDTKIDPISGEKITNYVGPKALRISPFDITFNPVAISFRESPKFTRYLKSIGELKKEVKQGKLNYDDSVIDKLIATRKQLTSFRMEDVNKSTGYIIDGFGSLTEYYQSGLIEILEFEGDVYDEQTNVLHENKIISIADRTQILSNIDNPSWLGQDSKVHVAWRERPDNLYGMGPLDNLVGLQYRVDHLENLKADALDLTIHPPLKKKGDVEPFNWGPGVMIDMAEDANVESMAPNQQAFMVNNEIGVLLALMEEMAGAPKEAMGFRTPGEKTAFEVDALNTAAQRIFRNKTNKFEVEFMEPLLNKMFELAKRNMDSTDVIRVLDDDLGVEDFINISKEDITASGKLRPIGSRHFAARAQLMQDMIGIFNSPVGQLIAPHISAKNLAKLIEERMGFEQFQFIRENAAIFEQADTQRLINQAQQTIQTEDSIPVEENLI